MLKKLPKIKTSLLKNKINNKTKNQSPNLIYNSILCISLMQFKVLVDKPVGGKEQNEMKQHKYKKKNIHNRNSGKLFVHRSLKDLPQHFSQVKGCDFTGPLEHLEFFIFLL